MKKQTKIVNAPKKYREEIRHTAECAFQRAIILGGQSVLNGQSVIWLDIELPVDLSGHARGRCVDLIGIDVEGNYVLCELKFRKKYRDNGNPEEAAKQLSEYMELIKANYKAFGSSYHHDNGKPINWEKVTNGNTRLVIAANSGYWESYFGPRRKGETYNTMGMECYSVDIKDDTFVNQKLNKKTYTPIMPEEGLEWNKIR